MKTFFKILFLLLIIALSCVFAFVLFLNRPTGNIPETGSEFEIVTGDNAYSIARRLFEEGYIYSKELFIVIPRVLRLDKSLQVGWVRLMPGENIFQMVKTIYMHEYVTISFTVPEGSTFAHIKRILLENEIVSSDDLETFLNSSNCMEELGLAGYKSIEGFLYPETYKFYKGVKIKAVFQGMVNLFFKKLEDIYPDYKKIDKDALYDKIIMASIIEREVKIKDEAALVAGVFYNRFKKRMLLQSCATVQYILDKPKEQLLEDDLKIDNPYNTYLYKGLPPTAISNPGFAALKASFFPAVHNYLFFVVKDTEKGSHHFSETYEEHLKNQKIYKNIKGFY